MNATDHKLTEIETTDLARIEGGLLVGGDDRCGTSFPGPRPLMVADLAAQVTQVAQVIKVQ